MDVNRCRRSQVNVDGTYVRGLCNTLIGFVWKYLLCHFRKLEISIMRKLLWLDSNVWCCRDGILDLEEEVSCAINQDTVNYDVNVLHMLIKNAGR